MTIETIDRAACKAITEAARVALEQVANDLGLTVKLGGGKYDPTTGTFSPKIEFALPDSDRRGFDANCMLAGLTPEDFGRTFTNAGKTYRISGINPRAPKYVIQAVDVRTGKTFGFPESVKRLLAS